MEIRELLKGLRTAEVLEGRESYADFVDSGSYALNKVISGFYSKGYPIGAITEIYGENSTGKTVLLTHAFASAQKKGYITALMDNEFSYNKYFAESLGVDSSLLLYDDPETVPACFARIEQIIAEIREQDKDTPILFGIDSLAGQSTEESSKTIDQLTNMDGAIRSREIGQCLRKINPILKKNRAGLIVINQTRVNPMQMYGDKTTKAGGGKALGFWSSVSIQTKSNKTSDVLVGDDGGPLGITGTVENKKNKIAIPFRECSFKLLYDKGLDPYYGLGNMPVEAGLLEKKGAWYTIKSSGKKFQGEDELVEYIKSNEELQQYLKTN